MTMASYIYKGSGKPRGAVAMSGGHYGPRTGASGVVDEVTEAWKMCKRTAEIMRAGGITVHEFYDTTSKSQSINIGTIVRWHNSKSRVLDVSFHLNAATATANGNETLYVTEKSLSEKMSAEICKVTGFRNRGAKYRKDLGFLNGTTKPAILLETFFCTSQSDVAIYRQKFEDICFAKAKVLAAEVGVTLTRTISGGTTTPTQPKEDEEMLTFPGEPSMNNEIQNALDAMVRDGLISKDRADKFKADKLSVKEATGILFVAFARLDRKGVFK